MRIGFDEHKRARTLAERGLDFAAAGQRFAGTHLTAEDTGDGCGEQRRISIGPLDGRLVVVVWTDRGGDDRRVISMRKADDRERIRHENRIGRPE